MRISHWVIIALSLSIPAAAIAATGEALSGYYVGHGDNAIVVFHPLSNGKATIGMVEQPTSAYWQPTKPTPKMVINAAKTKHGAWMGALKEVSPGQYRFVLGTPAHPSSYCIHRVTLTTQGVRIERQHGMVVGCDNYHGASSSYSAPSPSLLKQYPIGH